MESLKFIAEQEYLGRGILIGRTSSNLDLIVYFVTGRSPPSRARMLSEEWGEQDRVRTVCTDEEQLKKGTPDLLIYNAMRRVNHTFVVSNGAQTDVIAKEIEKNNSRSPARTLMNAFADPYWVPEKKGGVFTGSYIDLTSFEPDSPNFTPRISGVVIENKAALAICRNLEGQVERQYFEFPLIPGIAKFISTYTGQNVPKGEIIPSFRGAPLDIVLPGLRVESGNDNNYTSLVYDALRPKNAGDGIISPGEDFRVGVSTLLIRRQPTPQILSNTINAHAGKA